MKILIAGASGLIGNVLVNTLSSKYQFTVLGRNHNKLTKYFSNAVNKLVWQDLTNHLPNNYDLIINLSGLNISDKRWTSSVKQALIESRTMTNQRLIRWIVQHRAKPRYFSASAVSIYGGYAQTSPLFNESVTAPLITHDFLQEIGLQWERSLQTASDHDIPTVALRFGVVLKKGQGMLKKLELPFLLGAGSILGNGQQSLSWIHHRDLVKAFDFLIKNPEITGAINFTSPYPVTQRQFAHLLAKTLKRPLVLKMPGWLIKLLFGEMGQNLLLKGQKVIPQRLTDLGFKFDYPQLELALTKEYLNYMALE